MKIFSAIMSRLKSILVGNRVCLKQLQLMLPRMGLLQDRKRLTDFWLT